MPPPTRHCENWNRGFTRFFLACEKSDNNFEKTFIFLGEENELKDEIFFIRSNFLIKQQRGVACLSIIFELGFLVLMPLTFASACLSFNKKITYDLAATLIGIILLLKNYFQIGLLRKTYVCQFF